MGKNIHRTITTIIGVILSTVPIYSIFACGYSAYDNIMYNRYISAMGWDAMFVCDGTTAKEMLKLAPYYNEESDRADEVPSVSYAWVMAYDQFFIAYINDFDALPVKFRVAKGVLPNGKNGIAISQEISRENDVFIGDYFYGTGSVDPLFVEYYGGEPNMDLRVSGIVRNDFYIDEDYPYTDTKAGRLINHASFAVCLMSEEMFEGEGLLAGESVQGETMYGNGELFVFITFSDKKDITGQAAELARSYGCQEYEISKEALDYFNKADGKNSIIYYALEAALLVTAAISALAVLIIVRNAFNISAQERSRDYGILRCIGMSRKQIIRIILYEAAVVGAIGCVLGILLGHGFSWLGFRILHSAMGETTVFQIHVYGKAILRTVICILVVTAYSMISPIEKLYKVNPIESLNRTLEIKKVKEKKTKERKGKERKRKGKSKMDGPFGVEVSYAYRAARRNKGRFWMSVVTLTVGCTVLVTLSTGFETIKKIIRLETQEYQWSGYFPVSGYEEAERICSDLSKINGVSESEMYALLDIFERGTNGGKSVALYGVEPQVYDELVALSNPIEGKDSDVPQGAIEVIVSSYGGEDGKNSYTFEDTERSYTLYPTCLVDSETANKIISMYPTHLPWGTTYFYRLGGNFDIGDLKSSTEKFIFSSDYNVWLVLDDTKSTNDFDNYLQYSSAIYFENNEEAKQVLEVVRVIKSVGLMLFILLVVIYFTNALNLERAQMMTRREELGILEIIGLSKKQKRKMLLAESLSTITIALVAGFLLGNLIVLRLFFDVFITALYDEDYPISFSPDWRSMLICAGLLFATGILSVLLSGGKDESPVEKLRGR